MSAALMSALVNGILLSFVLVVAVSLILRLSGDRFWNASTRYIVWSATLIITLLLPVLLRIHWTSGTTRGEPVIDQSISRSDYQIEVTAGPWTNWVFRAWIVACGVMLLRLLLSCVVLHRRKTAAITPPFGRDRANGWLRRCGSTRQARLGISDDIAAPIAAGPVQPSILIPTSLQKTLSTEELDQIGLHEAAHLARRDDYTLVFQRVCEALFVFHPSVHWITRQMDLEREVACDDFVVEITGRPRPYAECLTRVAELAHGVVNLPLAAPATVPHSILERRLDLILDRKRKTGTRLLKARLACLIVAVVSAAWMSTAEPQLIRFAPPAEMANAPEGPAPASASAVTPGVGKTQPLESSDPAKRHPMHTPPPIESDTGVSASSLFEVADSKPQPDDASNPASVVEPHPGLHPAFEIAKIRASESYPGVSVSACRGSDSRELDFAFNPGILPQGWCVLVRHTLPGLISTAYQSLSSNGIEIPRRLLDQIIVGVPAWAGRDQFFDIEAKAENGSSVTEDELYRMLQTLLADRFKLKFHRQTREIDGFVMVTDSQGPRFKEATTADRGVGMPVLTRSLAITLDRPIVDKTGLTGRYEFTLAWTPDKDGLTNPELLEALREQLGLRLEPQSVRIDVIVIDSAEKPDGHEQ